MTSASFSKPCPICQQPISQLDIVDHLTKYHCTQVSCQTTQNFPLTPGQFPNNFNTSTNPIHQQQTQAYYSSPNSVSGGDLPHSFSTSLSNQSNNQYPMYLQAFHPGSCAIHNPHNCVFQISQSSDNFSRAPSPKLTPIYSDFPYGRRLISLSSPENPPSEPRYTSFNSQNGSLSIQSNIREKIASNLSHQFDFSIADTRTTRSPHSNDFSINSNVYETSNNNSSFNFSTSNFLNRQENLASSSSRNRLQLGEGAAISVEDSDDRNNLSDYRGNPTDSQEPNFDFPTENQNIDEFSTSNEPSSIQIEPEMPVLHPSNSNSSLETIEDSFPFPSQSDDDSTGLIIPHQPPINDHQMTQPGYNFCLSDRPDHHRVEDPKPKIKPHISNDDEIFRPPGFEDFNLS